MQRIVFLMYFQAHLFMKSESCHKKNDLFLPFSYKYPISFCLFCPCHIFLCTTFAALPETQDVIEM